MGELSPSITPSADANPETTARERLFGLDNGPLSEALDSYSERAHSHLRTENQVAIPSDTG
jgi:hypothetical protein